MYYPSLSFKSGLWNQFYFFVFFSLLFCQVWQLQYVTLSEFRCSVSITLSNHEMSKVNQSQRNLDTFRGSLRMYRIFGYSQKHGGNYLTISLLSRNFLVVTNSHLSFLGKMSQVQVQIMKQIWSYFCMGQDDKVKKKLRNFGLELWKDTYMW